MKQNTTPLSDSENLDASIHGVEEKLSSSKSTMIYALLSRGYIDRLSISNSNFRIYSIDDAFRFSLNCTFSRKRFSDIIPFLKNIRQRFDKKHFPKIKLLINRLIEDTVYKYPLLPALEAGKIRRKEKEGGKKSTFKPMPRIITAFNPGERREG